MDFRLEVVVIPVSDVDRAKAFYQGLGWRLDADFATGPDFRVVQLTPPGSACAVIFGTGVTSAAPGSAEGLQLVTGDIEAARAELAGRGVDASPVQTLDPRDGGKFCYLADPDGNNWAVQEIRDRVGASLD